MRALIVEQGRSRGALAATRALAADGWQVDVASPRRDGFASWSRAASAWHPVPEAAHDLDGFVSSVVELVRRGRHDVVFGGGEAEVLALSLRRDDLGAIVPYAEHDVVERALDKVTLAEAATAAGLQSPRILHGTARSGMARAVVKARMHAAPGRPHAPPRVDTNAVFGRDAVARRIDYVESLGAEPVVQEFLEGRLIAYIVVVDRTGAVTGRCQQEASSIWPPHAGASCRATTVAVDEDLAERASVLLRHLGWFGLAELQFIVPVDGVPRLIDLNGRFYGSLGLAVAAGANLPALWARAALGDLTVGRRAPATARPGVRYQWLEGDVRRALVERRGGLARDLVSCLRRATRSHHSVWDRRDPAPALRYVGTSVANRTRGGAVRGLRRTRGDDGGLRLR